MELILTNKHTHVWSHSSYSGANKKRTDYEPWKSTCAADLLRESRAGKDC
jgi:hypothetical protein